MSTLIIGAGPAGLAMAGQLAQLNQPFTVLEASEYIGFAWRNHYDRLHLHTVKAYSQLPHFPYPASYPTYVTRLQVVEYLERYAEQFNIRPLFNQKVTAISRNADGTWQVQTETDSFTAERVVVATGYNRIPNVPELPGQRNFRGIIWHSHEYRNGAPFRDENALVVGMGNTGAELALDLLEHGAHPFISVRGPVNIIRRDVFGKPAQPMAIFLSKFPNWFYDFVAGLSQKFSVGDVSVYGLGKPAHPPSYDTRRGKIPVIDIGTLDQIKAGRITVVPGIDRLNAKTVTFTDGRELPFDVIILATGYRPGLTSFLNPTLTARILNDNGYPKHLWFNEDALRGLYFLGYTTPLTGIIYNLTIDSDRIARHIAQNNFVSA
ncbi:flavin-containing monooxygenase [Spirosoma agri]|uniref:NAD(P)/FAD-dependent oxidoreductase n=1 Tax=Spirosoma agri TaxID=1987381 RepID=A0A6M0IMR2_9BACT|nr:NAD(P)/FAD-dependent oxidoreductase [Spirosoma agri]NEU68193.1 NAD(P)/FAD-dependent oxidoreductase [Spirosoma agri]